LRVSSDIRDKRGGDKGGRCPRGSDASKNFTLNEHLERSPNIKHAKEMQKMVIHQGRKDACFP
jgi:hypothetical protein